MAFLKHHRYFIFLLVIFAVAEILIDPTGEFPLNDDWAFSKALKIILAENRFTIGDWPAMSLVTHLLWGALFSKIFGFSFFILRLSTLLSAALSLVLLYKLLENYGVNKRVSTLACAVLLFNPIFFNLSNTYMTDVNFCTLLITSVYLAQKFFNRPHWLSFLLFFIVSTLLILIRQHGVIAPLCFTLCVLTLREKRIAWLSGAIVCTAAAYGALLYYESYLKTVLPSHAAYKYSGGVNITSAEFWEKSSEYFRSRNKSILVQVLFYTFPISIAFFPSLFRNTKKMLVVLAFLFSFCVTGYFFSGERVQIPNVFTDMSLGPETFYQSLQHDGTPTHTYSETWVKIRDILKLVFLGLNLAALVLLLIRPFSGENRVKVFDSKLFYPFVLMLSYMGMISITESHFDRYHIPVFALGIILLSVCFRNLVATPLLALLPLALLIYISVGGTRDYLQMNEKRWQALRFLTDEKKVPQNSINGGFEVNCWNEGQNTWWSDILTTKNYSHIIQYDVMPGFKTIKEFPFQRVFPFKKDTVRVLERN